MALPAVVHLARSELRFFSVWRRVSPVEYVGLEYLQRLTVERRRVVCVVLEFPKVVQVSFVPEYLLVLRLTQYLDDAFLFLDVARGFQRVNLFVNRRWLVPAYPGGCCFLFVEKVSLAPAFFIFSFALAHLFKQLPILILVDFCIFFLVFEEAL